MAAHVTEHGKDERALFEGGFLMKPNADNTIVKRLEIYDAFAESKRTFTPYQTHLNPPPADPNYCHPPKQSL